MSADLVGFSLLMGRDEAGTLAELKKHRQEVIDPKIAEYDGRIVKTTGDGLLVEFASVVDAVRCAVDVQRAMAERNDGRPHDHRFDFRIGVNVGDIIIDGDDIFGDGVNVAARLQTLSEPGGVCVSKAVRDEVLNKLSFAFEDLGPQHVKNIVQPVDVFRVAMGAASPVTLDERTPPRAPLRGWPIRTIAALAALVVVGLVAWGAVHVLDRPKTIAAYSPEDRRMTFAVLPFSAPAGDERAAHLASLMTDAAIMRQEHATLWAQVVPRARVEQTIRLYPGLKNLALALDVHFLVRGAISRDASGHRLELLVLDGASERVLETRSVPLPTREITSRRAFELVDEPLGQLTFVALGNEVDRARAKPFDQLDVRDLAFRAYADWGKSRDKDGRRAYTEATRLLDRALALAPDDRLALYVTARLNVCDCVEAWSTHIEEQQAIAAAALDKYLARYPSHASAIMMKADLYGVQGKFEESLLLSESVLKRDPADTDALYGRAFALLKLGRPQEALPVASELLDVQEWPTVFSLVAAIQYELALYDAAARSAQQAVTRLSRAELANRKLGAVRLTQIAAEARLGNVSRARIALADFKATVPGVDTVSAMKAWIHPGADLAQYEPLFEGLRLAGVPG